MQWNDEGFLLSKNKYSENSLVIEVFTLNHGKCSGIVYGGTSRKIKNYLQLGNKIHLNLKKKNENKFGYFKVEIIDAISPFLFDNNNKICCLFSSLNLLKKILPESHIYKNIYILFSNFLNKLKFSENWIAHYIFWEMNFIKEVGFDLNLSINLDSGKDQNNMIEVIIDNEKVSIPSFLVKKETVNIDNRSLQIALSFIGRFLEKNIFIPNNLKYPFYRRKLESIFDSN